MKNLILALALCVLSACGGTTDDEQTIQSADGRQVIEQCYEDCGGGNNNGMWIDSSVTINFTTDATTIWKPTSITIASPNGTPFGGGVFPEANPPTVNITFTYQGPYAPTIGVHGYMSGTTFFLDYTNAQGVLVKQTAYPNFSGYPVHIKRWMVDI